MKNFVFTMLAIAFMNQIYAQNYKFGKVSKEELAEQFYAADSTANAVYLYKKRRTYTNVNSRNIELITEVHVRLKLYNQEGFDWATESIRLFGDENIGSTKAVTYTLVDGNIEETKLSKKDIFSKEIRDELIEKKFTMPNLKPGSIVEWTYKIYSPYYTSIDDVVVQYGIPVKKYETQIRLLEWFNFNKKTKGFYPFSIIESKKVNHDLNSADNVILIEATDVPAIIEEPFVNNIYNYTAGVEIEVASLRAPEYGLYEDYATSWEEIAKDIYNSDSFGGELKKIGHLKDDISIIKSESTTLSEKVVHALQYVKTKIKWNNNNGEYPERGLRKAYKEGTGNIGDINLTLVAVLRELGLDANPVLMSTRSNGVPLFPTKKGINYVIAHVKTNNGYILLDASEKYSLPNVLPQRALNWQGIVIRKKGSIEFVVLENKASSKKDLNLSYKISEDGFVEGMNRVKYENLYSIKYRNGKANLDEEDLISSIETSNEDIEIVNFRLSNKDKINKPITEMYTFEKEDGAELIGDKMYLNPLLFNSLNENPFKLDQREYPIDFGAPWQSKNNATIIIPEGYKVESIPESIAIGLTDGLGKFVYEVKSSGSSILVSSLFEINSGVISSLYYSELKEFYKIVVAKQTEKIVLSKI